MEKQPSIDSLDTCYRMHTLVGAKVVDPTNTIFGTNGLEPEKAQKLAKANADQAQREISTWLTKRLQSVEWTICDLESTRPTPEFLQSLNDIQKKLKERREKLTSLFESTHAYDRLVGRYYNAITEIDGLTKLLIAFMPSLTPVQSPSDPRWKDRNATGFRLRALIQPPSRLRKKMDEARGNFNATATALQLLQLSIRLAAANEEAHDAESCCLKRETRRQDGVRYFLRQTHYTRAAAIIKEKRHWKPAAPTLHNTAATSALPYLKTSWKAWRAAH
ncbi:hypothetical protein F4825DRAFT_457849 [Nemania diffusa]|nr:hypothetical protein F4825DRAFT_457849 [Nemania diffusa]